MARTTLRIAVPEYIGDALCTLAWREDRDPKRQAERLIREGLERAGVLPLDVTDYREVHADRIPDSLGPEAASRELPCPASAPHSREPPP